MTIIQKTPYITNTGIANAHAVGLRLYLNLEETLDVTEKRLNAEIINR